MSQSFQIPSTRKQKAEKKRSRQLDVMSDLENMDIMLGSYFRNEVESHKGVDDMDVDLESGEPHNNGNPFGDDFRPILNINRRENSEVIAETVRMIDCVTTSQVSRKLNGMKTDLNSQIREAIDSAITEQILPSIQNTLGKQGKGVKAELDLMSSARHRSPEVENTRKV